MSEEIINEEHMLRLLNNMTEFERDVLLTTYKIPNGKVSTYKRIAEKVGRPLAYRAVGNALHKNPFAPTIPCHRVVRSDGGFGGEKEGAESRMKRLEKEGIPIMNGRVNINRNILF